MKNIFKMCANFQITSNSFKKKINLNFSIETNSVYFETMRSHIQILKTSNLKKNTFYNKKTNYIINH